MVVCFVTWPVFQYEGNRKKNYFNIKETRRKTISTQKKTLKNTISIWKKHEEKLFQYEDNTKKHRLGYVKKCLQKSRNKWTKYVDKK